MSTMQALDKWARDAVTLALYECLLGAACQMKSDSDSLDTEAFLRSPSREAWAEWQARRKPVTDDDARK